LIYDSINSNSFLLKGVQMANPASVEQIMKRVRDYVKYGNIDASKIFDLEEFNKSCAQNNENWNVDPGFLPQSKSRLIGPLINICKKIIGKIIRLAFRPYYRKQNLFNASVTKSINEILKMSHTYDAVLLNLKEKMELKDEENEAPNTIIENIFSCIEKANEEIAKQKQSFEDQANALMKENKILSDRLKRLERKMGSQSPDASENKELPTFQDTKKSCDFDYFLFEQKFRSPEKNIKNYQKYYLGYFSEKDNVLDIGCGRGEFLELLRENGIKAKGIDIENDFVAYCIDKGLDVEKADAVIFLDKLEDNVLSGVFMSHVVEHLDFDYLNCLIGLSYKKIKPNGYIILETPNPTTLAIFTNAFYVDPTHNKPVHPETLKFLLNEAGFTDIEMKTFDFSKIAYSIPPLRGDQIHNLTDFNNGIGLLNSILFGYQDYTLIAKK
jgi:2-polyprenyl-3-methyl-5-hydroxy-6-metoxy-1,4-benzoquinol methylase